MSSIDPNSSLVQEFLEFLRFPSISTQPEHTPDLRACAQWLHERFLRMGLQSEVLETGGQPVVLARSFPDPTKKTVLIYGHYDVQPPDPLDLWHSPPFAPVIREGKIWARGSSDNKGQIFAHIAGLEKLLRETGEIPVNVIFLVEGEEEIGSPSLPAFLQKHRDALQCDVVVISDSGMAADGFPTLAYALRGVAALEVRLTGPAQDLHSGVYGGAIMNPLAAAARLIASLHDKDGRIAIEGLYDSVLEMADWERAATAAAPVNDADILAQTGAPALFGEPGYNSVERIGARPTAEVNGMGGGYQGEGTKTVLPREAFFKLTFRLVPDQQADHILDLAEAHLHKHCPSGVTMTITRGHSGEAYFSDPQTPFGQAAQRALERAFGQPPCLLREGGSIPILHEFRQILGVDCLLLGLASPDCNAHSPNESFPLTNLALGLELHRAVLEEIAAVEKPSFHGDITPEAIQKNAATC
jgi:acetylornithine deacetylase/succinyl-diaminopimelate desuccinylase-like protein